MLIDPNMFFNPNQYLQKYLTVTYQYLINPYMIKPIFT